MITLWQGDCLELMKQIPDGSVDMILQDPPYNTTACKWEWDIMTKIDAFWAEWKRIIKPNGAIVMTASQPFTTRLIASNYKDFKYSWVWDKRFAANFVQAKRMPLRIHEDVIVFCKSGKTPRYYPQMMKRDIPIKKGGNKPSSAIPIRQTETATKFSGSVKEYCDKYPETVIEFNCRDGRGLHPTQKPSALMEYLIKTYTNEGDTVFDGFAGSGTTGVACRNTGRRFIGVELDPHYFEIAEQRINAA